MSSFFCLQARRKDLKEEEEEEEEEEIHIRGRRKDEEKKNFCSVRKVLQKKTKNYY